MPFNIVQGNLAKFRSDALVNAANEQLKAGGGLCGALFESAGHQEMQQACDAIGRCEPGQAVITPAFRLHADYVIHTVGPKYHDGTQGEAAVLSSCYTNSLKLAAEHKVKSIAFPLVSTGLYGYPRAEALAVATHAIRAFLNKQDAQEMNVTLVLYDRLDAQLDPGLQARIQELLNRRDYLRADQIRTEQSIKRTRGGLYPTQDLDTAERQRKIIEQPIVEYGAPMSVLDDLVDQVDGSFSESLLKLIDQKGMVDPEVYKRANLDRRHFAKLRKKEYQPSKQTVLALAIALRLSEEETERLLGQAGYAFSDYQVMDVIVRYFIRTRDYDIDMVNLALFRHAHTTLGA